jgi:hypothetical protein
MRAFTRLLYAAPSNMGSAASLSEALALLPPIPLYRRILRVHRKKLDPEMRILGDSYVKSEFRAHRGTENPLHIVRPLWSGLWLQWCGEEGLVQTRLTSWLLQIGFLTEWQLYAQKLEGDSWIGEKLDQGKLDKMSGASTYFLLTFHPLGLLK